MLCGQAAYKEHKTACIGWVSQWFEVNAAAPSEEATQAVLAAPEDLDDDLADMWEHAYDEVEGEIGDPNY